MRNILIALLCLWPLTSAADEHRTMVESVVSGHILPGFERFSEAADSLNTVALADCSAESDPLRQAYSDAFDAWLGVSHLRFGPTEVNDRAFAIAFWPDTKGFTPKTLAKLIQTQDSTVADPEIFETVSIAGRGLFALEFLLYDQDIQGLGNSDYQCILVRAVALDIAAIGHAIFADWQDEYTGWLLSPGGESPYRTEEEVVQELYKALGTGLQFTSETRIGRPMGTFERPRPNRAEARRSERSLRNVTMSLAALRDLASRLSVGHDDIAANFEAGFGQSLALASDLNDPVFSGVATAKGRLRVELLQQSIDTIRQMTSTDLGAHLGVTAGFNALDGD